MFFASQHHANRSGKWKASSLFICGRKHLPRMYTTLHRLSLLLWWLHAPHPTAWNTEFDWRKFTGPTANSWPWILRQIWICTWSQQPCWHSRLLLAGIWSPTVWCQQEAPVRSNWPDRRFLQFCTTVYSTHAHHTHAHSLSLSLWHSLSH